MILFYQQNRENVLGKRRLSAFARAKRVANEGENRENRPGFSGCTGRAVGSPVG